MPAHIALQWDHLRIKLRNCGIFRTLEHDCLISRYSKGMNSIRVKDVYQSLIRKKQSSCNTSFPCIFWKSGCPSKMVFFSWLLFHNKNLSWENLKKRGWQGPGVCPICRSAEEDNYHLFLNCNGSQQLWLSLGIVTESSMCITLQSTKRFYGAVSKKRLGGQFSSLPFGASGNGATIIFSKAKAPLSGQPFLMLFLSMKLSFNLLPCKRIRLATIFLRSSLLCQGRFLMVLSNMDHVAMDFIY